MKTYAGRIGASETTLASGRPIIAGEKFTLSDDEIKDPHNKRLIDEGFIVEQKPKQKPKGGSGS